MRRGIDFCPGCGKTPFKKGSEYFCGTLLCQFYGKSTVVETGVSQVKKEAVSGKEENKATQ